MKNEYRNSISTKNQKTITEVKQKTIKNFDSRNRSYSEDKTNIFLQNNKYSSIIKYSECAHRLDSKFFKGISTPINKAMPAKFEKEKSSSGRLYKRSLMNPEESYLNIDYKKTSAKKRKKTMKIIIDVTEKESNLINRSDINSASSANKNERKNIKPTSTKNQSYSTSTYYIDRRYNRKLNTKEISTNIKNTSTPIIELDNSKNIYNAPNPQAQNFVYDKHILGTKRQSGFKSRLKLNSPRIIKSPKRIDIGSPYSDKSPMKLYLNQNVNNNHVTHIRNSPRFKCNSRSYLANTKHVPTSNRINDVKSMVPKCPTPSAFEKISKRKLIFNDFTRDKSINKDNNHSSSVPKKVEKSKENNMFEKINESPEMADQSFRKSVETIFEKKSFSPKKLQFSNENKENETLSHLFTKTSDDKSDFKTIINSSNDVIDRVRNTLSGLYKNKGDSMVHSPVLKTNTQFNFSRWKASSKEIFEQKCDKRFFKTEECCELDSKYKFTLESIDELSKKEAIHIPKKGSRREIMNFKQPSKWSKLNLVVKRNSKSKIEFGKDRNDVDNTEGSPSAKNNLNYLINTKIEDFEFIGKTLGEGGSATVRMAYYRKSKDRYAIKTFNR